jgi:hypothetical protein
MWSRPIAVCGEQAIEGHEPVEPADLLTQAVRSQQVAHAAARADDA